MVLNNLETTRVLRLLNINNAESQRYMQQAATGMKINSAQDDASAYSISERMRVKIRSLDKAHGNVQNDSALLKTVQGGGINIVENLRRLKELAINAANDSNTDADRQTIQKEFNQIIDQIDDNALTKALDEVTTIGSIESHLEYMADNLTTSVENVQSSESVIRDAEFKRVARFTRIKIFPQKKFAGFFFTNYCLTKIF